MAGRITGTVKFFAGPKGYGFITLDSGRDLWMHITQWVEDDDPVAGDRVSCLEGTGHKGPVARQVMRVRA